MILTWTVIFIIRNNRIIIIISIIFSIYDKLLILLDENSKRITIIQFIFINYIITTYFKSDEKVKQNSN